MTHPTPAIVNDSFAWRLALVYAGFFAVSGWNLPLFPVWLSARGLDPGAIGLVMAAFQLVRTVATPIGTRLADRQASLKAAIATAAIMTAATVAVVACAEGFAAVLATVIL